MSINRLSVGILGATGPVGQKLVALLRDHPTFQLTHLYSSSRTAGKKYIDGIRGRMFECEEDISYAFEYPLLEVESSEYPSLVFSALKSSAAEVIEPVLLEKGVSICSNASAYRMDEIVPVILADVNPSHLKIVQRQRAEKGWKGILVTNSNCSTSGIITALAPLVDFGIENLTVSTYQALSGAGHPGHSAQSMLGNVIPFIPEEEKKIAVETRLMLGRLIDCRIVPPDFKIEAFCARVPVANGHLISINVALQKDVTEDDIISAWNNWNNWSNGDRKQLHSSSLTPVKYLLDESRPQPRYDLNREKGFAVTIGRLRKLETGRFGFVLLVNNLVRGAAGAAIMNGELLVQEGYLGKR